MAGDSPKAVWFALIANTLIAVAKFIGGSITKSSAMFSEGVHSLVDTGNQGLLLLGLKRSKLPADKQFPFGHGKEIYFWSFVVALLIFALGSGITLYEGFHQLMHPQPVNNVMINYIILGFAFLVEGFAWYTAYVEFKKDVDPRKGFFKSIKDSKDPTNFVVLFEDSAAMLGLVIAFLGLVLGQVTGWAGWDGVASISIGVILALTAWLLAVETKGLLIGESAETELVEKITKNLLEHKEVETVKEVLSLHMGPKFILLNISIDFKDDLSVGDLEKLLDKLVQETKKFDPRVKRIFIEPESV